MNGSRIGIRDMNFDLIHIADQGWAMSAGAGGIALTATLMTVHAGSARSTAARGAPQPDLRASLAWTSSSPVSKERKSDTGRGCIFNYHRHSNDRIKALFLFCFIIYCDFFRFDVFSLEHRD